MGQTEVCSSSDALPALLLQREPGVGLSGAAQQLGVLRLLAGLAHGVALAIDVPVQATRRPRAQPAGVAATLEAVPPHDSGLRKGRAVG